MNNLRLAQRLHCQELETAKAGPPNQKDVLDIPSLICTQRTFAKKNRWENGIQDLAFWQRSACWVDMKTLKSPTDEMTSKYQTVSSSHTSAIWHFILSYVLPQGIFLSAHRNEPSNLKTTGWCRVQTAPTIWCLFLRSLPGTGGPVCGMEWVVLKEIKPLLHLTLCFRTYKEPGHCKTHQKRSIASHRLKMWNLPPHDVWRLHHILHLDSCPNTVTIDGAGAYTVLLWTFCGDDFPLIHQVVKHLESDRKKNAKRLWRKTMQGMEWFQQVVQCVARWWFAILFFDKSIVHFGCKLYLRQSLNVIFGNLRKCVLFVKCWNWTLVDHFMLACSIIYPIFRPPRSQRSRNTTHPVSLFLETPESFRIIFHWLGI